MQIKKFYNKYCHHILTRHSSFNLHQTTDFQHPFGGDFLRRKLSCAKPLHRHLYTKKVAKSLSVYVSEIYFCKAFENKSIFTHNPLIISLLH